MLSKFMKFMEERNVIIVKIIIGWLVITTIINAYLMTVPKLDLKKEYYPEKYQIEHENRIEIQKNNECAAFSTAYVLRHMRIEADGEEIYTNFSCKMKSGCVYPKGIRRYLKQSGFKTNYYKGNINSLKKQINKGIPVIVFIKARKEEKYLHFVPVTGYDKDNLYIAESLDNLVNYPNNGGSYNRQIPINEFEKLWDIKSLRIPTYSNTYITIEANQGHFS
jgi:ABC-type bacteriocin/lantibiotic exporter with double-glycine peptidase domain